MAKALPQATFYNYLGLFGLVLAAVLIAAAVGVKAGRDFANNQVRSQLVQEKISFPPAGSPGLDTKEFPTLQKYGGQLVDNGIKAKAYADEFIWAHMMKSSGGKTYAEVSALAMANKQDQKLAALKNTLFQGDMLRSSLLTAYAFSVFGMIAGYAFPLLLLGAAIILALSLVSLARARQA
jgi:hypothetical protein